MKVNRMFHNYKTEKITREASDAAKNPHYYIELFGSSARDPELH